MSLISYGVGAAISIGSLFGSVRELAGLQSHGAAGKHAFSKPTESRAKKCTK
jgi:hypothetical protein